MSRQVAVLLIVASLVGPAACGGKYVSQLDRAQAFSSFETGSRLLSERKFAQALTLLQQAATLDPDVPMYRNVLGIAHLQMSRPDLALVEFKHAVAVDDDFAEAQLNLGTALAEQRQWADAAVAYQRAIKSPRLASTEVAYQNLGLALYHLQRLQEAESALRFAIDLDPTMAPAYYHLGLVLVAGRRTEEARRALERARDLGPNTPFGQAAADRLKSLGGGG